MDNIYDAAIEYVKLGWYVFPLHSLDDNRRCTCGISGCSDAGKHPRVRRGLKEATRDLSMIDKWFSKQAPLSNLAIVTGEKSGITVIDIDIGEGKFGADSWAEIIKEHGEPVTLISQTGSGGTHLIFKYNSALKTASNVLGKGIDSRNDGGYIVAPPSKHKSGKKYKWDNWGSSLAILPSHLSQRRETRGRKKKNDVYENKYTLEQVKSMLEVIPGDDRDLWRFVGVILGREFNRIEEAWKVYIDWSEKWGGKKGRGHDQIMYESFHEISQDDSEKQLSIATIIKAAIDNGWAPTKGEVPITNFIFYGPGNNYIYRPTNINWIQGAVDAAVSPVNIDKKIIKATVWLKENQLVTSMTCDPAIGEDFLKGYDCRMGEVIRMEGAALFNSYRYPTIEAGDAKLAKQFADHIHLMMDKAGDADQFLNFMAHRVQKPEEKPRFALLISGGQGVGKDTAIDFCAPALGIWNVANIEPSALESSFNEYAQATLIRINEAANLHDMTKWAFNERTKVLIAGTPDFCEINPKYGQKYSIRMHCGVIITTNHLAEGIYIPQDDRRYDVIDCASLKEMGLGDEKIKVEYFTDLWSWWLSGGKHHIVAFLQERDISKFSANLGQRKTNAHATIVAGGLGTDQWLDDILDALNYPMALRSDWIMTRAIANGENDYNIRRKLSNAMGRMGYVMLKSSNQDGRWKIGGKKVTVYAKPGLPKTFDPKKELSEDEF